MKHDDNTTFMHMLKRVPKRATIEQMRASFKGATDQFVMGATSRGFMELRDGFYYPTAAGKHAVADFLSSR